MTTAPAIMRKAFVSLFSVGTLVSGEDAWLGNVRKGIGNAQIVRRTRGQTHRPQRLGIVRAYSKPACRGGCPAATALLLVELPQRVLEPSFR